MASTSIPSPCWSPARLTAFKDVKKSLDSAHMFNTEQPDTTDMHCNLMLAACITDYVSWMFSGSEIVNTVWQMRQTLQSNCRLFLHTTDLQFSAQCSVQNFVQSVMSKVWMMCKYSRCRGSSVKTTELPSLIELKGILIRLRCQISWPVWFTRLCMLCIRNINWHE